MGRLTKQGIDFFSLDVQFDDKTELYLMEMEAAGLAVMITLWQLIYQNEGYYINNSEDLSLLIKHRINVDIKTIDICVNAMLKRCIFDKELHKKYGVLTSKAIQKRYFDAAKRKKEVKVIKKYTLVGLDNYENIVYVNINGIDVNINGIDVVKNATKEKEEEKEKEKIYNFWNNQKIIVHKKLDDKTKTALNTALKNNTEAEIIKAIENYTLVLNSDTHYWTYKWGLLDFLNRGLRKFIVEADPVGNYSKGKDTPATDQSYASIMANQPPLEDMI